MCAKSLQSCPTLCDPMDCSPPGFSVHEILQERILEWDLPDPGIEPTSDGFFTTESLGKPRKTSKWESDEYKMFSEGARTGRQRAVSVCVESGCPLMAAAAAVSLQSCPTLCDPMDCSLPGSSVHGILQGKNTGVGCHALLQGIFLTQGLNPWHLLCLLHFRQILYH